jgi:hypothetical protein
VRSVRCISPCSTDDLLTRASAVVTDSAWAERPVRPLWRSLRHQDVRTRLELKTACRFHVRCCMLLQPFPTACARPTHVSVLEGAGQRSSQASPWACTPSDRLQRWLRLLFVIFGRCCDLCCAYDHGSLGQFLGLESTVPVLASTRESILVTASSLSHPKIYFICNLVVFSEF